MKLVFSILLALGLSQLALAQTKYQPHSSAAVKSVYTSQMSKGGVNSGGGGIYLAEFYAIARKSAEEFRLLGSGYIGTQVMDLTVFSQAVAQMDVEMSSTPLLLDGQEKDAINFPDEMKVIFYSGNWEKIDSEAKELLVIHELLGLLRIPDFQNSLSQELVRYKARHPMLPIKCLTKVNGKIVQQGLVTMYQSPGEPEGAGHGVIFEGLGLRVIADEYPLNIFVQAVGSEGLVWQVYTNSKFDLARQFLVNAMKKQGSPWTAQFYKRVEDTKFEVTCVETLLE